jgi:hypothetical protein
MKARKVAVLTLMAGLATTATAAARSGREAVTFAVGCYDVGAATLQGRQGVISVEKGWRDGREVNRVVFDPRQVSVPSMEAWLKGTGTYLGTEPTVRQDQKENRP